MAPSDFPDDDVDLPKSPETNVPREVICPMTGCHVVARRPGQRRINTKEVKEMLKEFP
jgi:hypothetical protein